MTRDRIMAPYAPVALLLLPAAWITLVVVGYTLMFWAIGVRPLSTAFVTSGSSLLTLGFERPDGLGALVLSFTEAALGMAVIALLLVTYLPSMYAAYSDQGDERHAAGDPRRQPADRRGDAGPRRPDPAARPSSTTCGPSGSAGSRPCRRRTRPCRR